MSEAGEGWSDSRIGMAALETSASMVYRVRKQLVEEGLEAALSRKQRATPAVAPIFDGEKEAKLIALACSKPPKGRARWTLRLLERKVVELERIPDKQVLADGVAAWEQDRNKNHAKADWRFTTPDARIKLKHLYPSI